MYSTPKAPPQAAATMTPVSMASLKCDDGAVSIKAADFTSPEVPAMRIRKHKLTEGNLLELHMDVRSTIRP